MKYFIKINISEKIWLFEICLLILYSRTQIMVCNQNYIKNIEENFPIKDIKFIVGLDHKMDVALSVEYYNNLVGLSKRKNNLENSCYTYWQMKKNMLK